MLGLKQHTAQVFLNDTLSLVAGWLHGTAVERQSLAGELSCPELNV